MKNLSLFVLVAAISFIAGAGLTYVAKTPWTADMANQPSIKPQEWPMLPPQGSVTTDLTGSTAASSRKTSESEADHQEMGHQHGTKDAAGHHHDTPGTKHDHDPAPKAPAKGTEHNHSAAPHSHASGADHDHGTSDTAGHKHGKSAPHKHGTVAHSHGQEKAEKTKTKKSPAAHQHGPGEGGHSHASSNGHADGHAHSQAQVVNPIKPTEASVKKGHQLFNIYCSVCHGPEGKGGMPMESKLSAIPKFTAELLRSVDDNHMFSMLTSGHGPMPGYAEALTPQERWHVTNYVRTLQKKLAEEKKVTARQGASR